MSGKDLLSPKLNQLEKQRERASSEEGIQSIKLRVIFSALKL